MRVHTSITKINPFLTNLLNRLVLFWSVCLFVYKLLLSLLLLLFSFVVAVVVVAVVVVCYCL